MKTITDKDYIVYFDENNNPVGGEPIDPNTSLITNLEDVTNEKIEGFTEDEIIGI